MAGFMDFLQQNTGGGPTGPMASRPLPGSLPTGTPQDAGGEQSELMLLLMLLAQAIEQRQGGIPDDQASQIPPPNMAGTGSVNLSGAPNVGDLADMNNEVGGNPLAGLFGQMPPPGVSRRRGY